MSKLEFNELPVEIVSVHITVAFKAYALAPESEMARAARDEKILAEIADAIEYRASNAMDTEEGDGLVAVWGAAATRGSVMAVTSGHPDVTSADVLAQAEGISGSR